LEAINMGIERLPQKTKKVFQLNRLEGRSITSPAPQKQLRLNLKDFILLLILACA